MGWARMESDHLHRLYKSRVLTGELRARQDHILTEGYKGDKLSKNLKFRALSN